MLTRSPPLPQLIEKDLGGGDRAEQVGLDHLSLLLATSAVIAIELLSS